MSFISSFAPIDVVAANSAQALALAPDTPCSPTIPGKLGLRKKGVQFAPTIQVGFTHRGEDYDRSSHPPARLTFRDCAEMMQVRAILRRQAEALSQGIPAYAPIFPSLTIQ
ncbi:MAG: hypothetical protein DHS80DRAFT_28950 [Piptocephalis tieghemiana]|nr:MAG: hypothetical protein DHS80DRAFT_28950 [Piptocephalis tieghemiana]